MEEYTLNSLESEINLRNKSLHYVNHKYDILEDQDLLKNLKEFNFTNEIFDKYILISKKRIASLKTKLIELTEAKGHKN